MNARENRHSARPLRVALVGCGAVSAANLMPVLAGYDGLVVTTLVDREEARARTLADAYAVPHVHTDMSALTTADVDAVVIATPPGHHASATIACAGKGLHVLVEKPMAITAADARAMVDAADRAGIALAVGLYRRFLPSVQLLGEMIRLEEFGRPLSVDAEEGGPYGWNLAALDGLTRSAGGGGVLIDIGSHVIDVILHVLNAKPVLESYSDNSRGGIETDCVLRAALVSRHDAAHVPLRLELSRTRELRGSIRVTCEHATLELMRGNFTEVLVHRRSGAAGGPAIQLSASSPSRRPFIGFEAFWREIHDWVTAIRTGAEPVLSGRSVVPVVDLIGAAYQARTPLVEPGTDDAPARPAKARVTRRRVLVTGAGGFLGGRTVELLRDRYGCDPVALVREPRGAARLARWPLDNVVVGDICSSADMDRVMRGCEAVVHCAVGTSWKRDEVRRVTVEGTRIVAEAALAAGVKRFVHISTLFVHQRDGVDVIDETVALEPPPSDSYGQNKLAAEQALATVAARGLSTIILRPTRIYGPFSRTFTIRPLQAMSQGRLVIGGNADVPANMVYVDNVVEAIASAVAAPESLNGSAYLITDEDQLSLREFYEYFGRANRITVGLAPDWSPKPNGTAPAGTVSRLVGAVRTIARSAELRGLVRKVLETDPIGTLPRRLWERSPALQQDLLRRFGADAAVIYRPAVDAAGQDLVYHGEPARVSVQKAQRELGFVQAVSREHAMTLTLEWARYARLLPE